MFDTPTATARHAAASLVAVPELLPRGIRATGNPAAPAWYVAGASVITAVAMLTVPESRHHALED